MEFAFYNRKTLKIEASGLKDAMSDFWPQTFFWVNGISKSIIHSYEKLLPLMVRNHDKNLKRFLFKTHELVTWYIVGISTKTYFEHFITLLLIIGGLFRAMGQMKACNFLDPYQNTYWI